MAIATTRPRPADTIWSEIHTLVDRAFGLARWVSRRRDERRTILHLSSLNDHQLRDIGLVRSNIAPAVRGQGAIQRKFRHAVD